MRRLIPPIVVALLALAVAPAPGAAASPVAAAQEKQPAVQGFYRGRTVEYFDFGELDVRPGNKLAPIWVFTNGAEGQRNVIDAVPGMDEYSPFWRVVEVTWAQGVQPRVLRSAQEVRDAAAAGQLTTRQTDMVVNCPVLGFDQVRHAGFSRGKTVRYYELGRVRVTRAEARDESKVVDLWAFTNGARGQRNVADVTPGQTAYPPLWSIVQVTWRRGAERRVLRSYAQIRRAARRGEVRLRRTSLIVNCPLI